MDGEVVVLDERGRPSFQRLQKRAQMRRPADVERGAVDAACYGVPLRSPRLGRLRPAIPSSLARKRVLSDLLPRDGPVRFTDYVEERGEELFAAIGRLGLEGMIAKRKLSPYRAGRSADWLKIRKDPTGDFAIVGFTAPKGARAGIRRASPRRAHAKVASATRAASEPVSTTACFRRCRRSWILAGSRGPRAQDPRRPGGGMPGSSRTSSARFDTEEWTGDGHFAIRSSCVCATKRPSSSAPQRVTRWLCLRLRRPRDASRARDPFHQPRQDLLA